MLTNLKYQYLLSAKGSLPRNPKILAQMTLTRCKDVLWYFGTFRFCDVVTKLIFRCHNAAATSFYSVFITLSIDVGETFISNVLATPIQRIVHRCNNVVTKYLCLLGIYKRNDDLSLICYHEILPLKILNTLNLLVFRANEEWWNCIQRRKLPRLLIG